MSNRRRRVERLEASTSGATWEMWREDRTVAGRFNGPGGRHLTKVELEERDDRRIIVVYEDRAAIPAGACIALPGNGRDEAVS